jgi:hypothetical protein
MGDEPPVEVGDSGTSVALSDLKWTASPRRIEVDGFSLTNNSVHALVAYKVRFRVYSQGSEEPLELQRTSDLTWDGPTAFVAPGGHVGVEMSGWLAPKGEISRVRAVVSYTEFDDGTREGAEAEGFSRELAQIRAGREAIYKKALEAFRRSGPKAALGVAAAAEGVKGPAADTAGLHLAAIYDSAGASGLEAELERIAGPASRK